MTLTATNKGDVLTAVTVLRNGGVIAYPTEAVYGFGCDPFNQTAVTKLLTLKKRNPRKGLILVASNFAQIEHLIMPIAPQLLAHVLETWPGPFTWVFPASQLVPAWIRGDHNTVALRVSAHPIVKQLCDQFCGPIVSTSANLEGELPTRDYRATHIAFKDAVDVIIKGAVGKLARPTEIRDAITNEVLR